jgi:hypothetical protein
MLETVERARLHMTCKKSVLAFVKKKKDDRVHLDDERAISIFPVVFIFTK